MNKILYAVIFTFCSFLPASAQTAPDVYETVLSFPANVAAGDYIEFLKVTPLNAGASGYYEISISYTRGNIAAAATHLTSVSHSNPDSWRETGRINSNGYGSAGTYMFTVDVNPKYNDARFRVRALAAYGVQTDPIAVYVKVRSINRQYNWTVVSSTGNDLSVSKFQPMTDEWTLLMGNGINHASAVIGLHVKQNGDVGVGTKTPQSKFSVAGTITAQKVKVSATGWPDYVFEKDYELPDLDEVARFVSEKKHLSGIPSAKAVEQEGQDVGEMNKKLLQKVEELTLYLINEQRERKKLEADIKALKKEIEGLKN